MATVDPRVVQVVIDGLPDVLAFVRAVFGVKNPDAPVPTDAEIQSAFESAFVSSAAKDEQWLASHPETPSA